MIEEIFNILNEEDKKDIRESVKKLLLRIIEDEIKEYDFMLLNVVELDDMISEITLEVVSEVKEKIKLDTLKKLKNTRRQHESL